MNLKRFRLPVRLLFSLNGVNDWYKFRRGYVEFESCKFWIDYVNYAVANISILKRTLKTICGVKALYYFPI